MIKYVSVLVPLMLVDDQVDVAQEVARTLGLPLGAFTIRSYDDQSHLAVQISELRANFLQLEELAAENRRLLERYERVKELVKPVEERPSISVDNDFENLMRKAKKLKEVKEENRKLRKLLQYEVNLRRVQLDNTEKIREETQKTMSNLKDEFDALVKEMHRGGPHRPDFSARYQQS